MSRHTEAASMALNTSTETGLPRSVGRYPSAISVSTHSFIAFISYLAWTT